jgi:hypothetical protein
MARARAVCVAVLVALPLLGGCPLSGGDDAIKTGKRAADGLQPPKSGGSSIGAVPDGPSPQNILTRTSLIQRLEEDPVATDIGCAMVDAGIETAGAPSRQRLTAVQLAGLDASLDAAAGQNPTVNRRQLAESIVKLSKGDLLEVDDVVCGLYDSVNP